MIYVPVVAEMWARKDKKILEFSIANITKYLLILSLPICFTVMFYARQITTILFGDKFLGAYLVLIVYAPAILLVPLTKVFVPVLLSANETKYIAKISITCFLLDFIGNILLVPLYGAVGAQISSIAGMALLFVLVYIKVRKLISVPLKIKEVSLISVSAFLFFISIVGLNHLIKLEPFFQIVSCVLLAGIIYLIALFFLRLVTIAEIENIIKLRKNID
jgi:O-antigen/teichoic acid export membrane protein